jgi:serine O-acetyltransferase
MWSEICADARLYSALRWPGGAGALRRALIWLRSPGLLVLAVQRVNHHYRARRDQNGWTAETIALRMLLVLGRWPVFMLAKSELDHRTDIGHGVYLSDRGQLILGPKRIGNGTLIHDRVTIGTKAGESATPVVGENVWIGPDCVIYGNIALGDGATILPGSVVSMTVSAGAVAGGNPATIVREKFDNSRLRQTLATDVDLQSLTPR